MSRQIYLRLKSPTFYLAILGTLKLIMQAFGLDIISDEQVNTIANGLSALTTVVGVACGWESGDGLVRDIPEK